MRSAASCRMGSVVCPYRSRVNATVACPSWVERVLMFAPVWREIHAYELLNLVYWVIVFKWFLILRYDNVQNNP